MNKELTINIDDIGISQEIFGDFDENAKVLQDEFGVMMTLFENKFMVSGEKEAVEKCAAIIYRLAELIEKGEHINKNNIRFIIDLVRDGKENEIRDIMSVVAVTARGAQIRCKTLGQKHYVSAIQKNTMVLGVGPAGTGKTYLAVALAAMAYKNKQVERIVLTRPAVEAGERLGFLPGDLAEKVNPYLRPLYDALSEMLGMEYPKLIERGIIEIAPLAYMRGRTLNNAFIILDEAQNTTREQMKMFLTRMGENSKVVVTGDVTQIDLPSDKKSGLKEAVKILQDVKDLSIVFLTQKDVVRHPLVQRIINAYEKAEKDS